MNTTLNAIALSLVFSTIKETSKLGFVLLIKYLVFLREIEYYRGILFLTTNRVGGFDEAIMSRWFPNLVCIVIAILTSDTMKNSFLT